MAFLIDDVIKGIAKYKAGKSAAKEQKRAGEANLQADFEQRQASESNREDDRLARMGFVGNQLSGARALSPEVLAAALKRRQSAVRKGAMADPSKGLGWGLVGDMGQAIGSAAETYFGGKALQGATGGAEATSLRPAMNNFNPKIGAGMFQSGDCPPGQIC